MAGLSKTTLACPLCGYATRSVKGYERHLADEHATTSQALWNSANGGPMLCRCGCGTQTRWRGPVKMYAAMLPGHNGSIYKLYDAEHAAAIAEKRAEKLRGRSGWAKGLTKDDARIAYRAERQSQ